MSHISISKLLKENHSTHAAGGKGGALRLSGSNGKATRGGVGPNRKYRTYSDQYGRCYYCHTEIDYDDWTIDHLMPLSRGGSNKPENLRGACFQCNNEKGDMTEREYRDFMRLKRTEEVLQGMVQ